MSHLACCRPEVLVTLTTDEGKVGAALHGLKSGGESDLMTGIQVAQVRGDVYHSSLFTIASSN